ncbi:MAG TPA: hypothetical protein VIT65_04045 [Microlunatus sp.]
MDMLTDFRRRSAADPHPFAMPDADLIINTDAGLPAESAALIAATFELPLTTPSQPTPTAS